MQTARGDLQSLHDAMDAGSVDSKFENKAGKLKGKTTPGVDWGDLSEDESAREVAALKARQEELLNKPGEYALQAAAAGEEATLRALSALRNAQGAPQAIAAIRRQQNGGTARKTEDDRIARLSSRLDRLTDRLEKASEATTRAELDQERRDVAGQLLLERLRSAHRRLAI